MKPFFIVGLPRSRTAWLANLFTTENIHCFHELSAVYPVEQWAAVFRAVGSKYVGTSEPLPRTVLEAKKIFPESKLVVISRPVMESFKATLRAVRWVDQLSQYVFADPKKIQICAVLLKREEDYLELLKKSPGALVVKFNELNQNEVVTQIWRHCIPDIEADELRIAQLQEIRVTTKHETLDLDEVIWHFADRKVLLDDKLFGRKIERVAVVKSLQKLWLKFIKA